MMQFLLSFHQTLKKACLIFTIVMLFMFDSFAGDISVSFRYRIEVAMEDVEQPVITEITNTEDYQVLGAALNLTIRDKLSLDVAYQYSTDIGTVEPQSSVVLKAPDPWIPKAGFYLINYELTSLNDVNQKNDTLSYVIEVKPSLGLEFKFNQLSFINPFQQENSSTGRVDFKLPPSETNKFLNMNFTLPGNLSLSPQWLVQNLPVSAFPDTQVVSYWIDLEKIGVIDGVKIPYLSFDYSLSDTLVKEPTSATKLYYTDVHESDYNIGGDISNDWDYGLYLDAPAIDWGIDGFEVKTWNYRGCNVPNIDLDSSKYNPREMAGEVGDWNSCGPASAVNSLQWLEINDENINYTGTDLRDKMKIFNKVSGRTNENGLNTKGVIQGKLGTIDSLKIPVHVKWQGVPYDTTIASPNGKYNHSAESKNDSVGAYPTFEWLASEIEKGEDVEVKFGWYDTLNHRHGGHWVVVSGVSDVNIARGIYVKDDEDQGKEGGTRQTYVNWVTNEKGRSRLVGFKGANNRCWVESVVSESYDSTIAFTPTSVSNLSIENWFNLTVYENPSSRSEPVSVEFELDSPGKVQISVYEISGRLVFNQKLNYSVSGTKIFKWNGTESSGQLAESGIYVVKVISKNSSATAKFIRQ